MYQWFWIYHPVYQYMIYILTENKSKLFFQSKRHNSIHEYSSSWVFIIVEHRIALYSEKEKREKLEFQHEVTIVLGNQMSYIKSLRADLLMRKIHKVFLKIPTDILILLQQQQCSMAFSLNSTGFSYSRQFQDPSEENILGGWDLLNEKTKPQVCHVRSCRICGIQKVSHGAGKMC